MLLPCLAVGQHEEGRRMLSLTVSMLEPNENGYIHKLISKYLHI